MNDDNRWLDPFTAERLMRNARTESPAHDDALADLLAATTAAARPDELTGEEAAVCAFRNARLVHTSEPTRRSTSKSALAKLATKAAIVLAAASGSGIALAAASGHLPGITSPEHHITTRPGPSTPITANAPTSSTTTDQSQATSTGSTPRGATPLSSASPNLRQLCITFQASAGDDNDDQGIDRPASPVLVTVAGGEDQVNAYCSALLATPATTPPSQNDDQSTPAAHPTGGNGTSHMSPPTDGTSTHPSSPAKTPTPFSHPTPTTHPTPTPSHTH